ncbi:unnamed protein product [Symbiodinium natans]|uniref:Uncharacterized protein n=1 Tax=Symbiodinium natans TaxID=878477 RepID=A0A812T5I4_9DINO|nr:unnamed protein product [Symbiodinium natans]
MCLRLLHVFMIDARTQDSASGFRANHFLAYKHIRRRCFHGFRAFGVAPLSPMAAELPPYVQAARRLWGVQVAAPPPYIQVARRLWAQPAKAVRLPAVHPVHPVYVKVLPSASMACAQVPSAAAGNSIPGFEGLGL